ncbi:MAG TPA: hypothetical protein VHL81_05205 [Gemmatimonadales bacterium]|nr:hypothetical protein [Gemmatimonadales bacterium]
MNLTERRVIDGLAVTVINTRPDIDTEAVLSRLATALGLIRRYTPHYYRHLGRDFAGILVKRYECRGAYLVEPRICLVELTFVVNPDFSEAQVAATILHEAMHARLHRLGVAVGSADRARQERFCRRAEVEFGRLVPGGEPIVQRARASLALADAEVAPEIDRSLAAERIARVDVEAMRRLNG